MARIGVPGTLASFRGRGESRRMDSDDGARGRLRAAEPICCAESPAVIGGSAPGTGDGAAELRATAAALRICARTWEAWRSVKKATCWRRKSTVTWNRVALQRVNGGAAFSQGVLGAYMSFPVISRHVSY